MVTKNATTPTRISTDVFELAAAVAAVEHRSTAEQVSHWARIGMLFERHATAERSHVAAAVSGDTQFSHLGSNEREVAHALVDANIARRVASERFGAVRRASGRRTASLDDDANVIEVAADGTTRRR
jgi:hypothetical protein